MKSTSKHAQCPGADGSFIHVPSGIAELPTTYKLHAVLWNHFLATVSRRRGLCNAVCRGHGLHNPKRTARPPSTVTARLETQVVEDNVYGVIAMGIECSAHGGPSRHPHRAVTKTMPSPVAAEDTVPASGTLASWIPMKLVPTWLIVTTTGVCEIQEHRLPGRYCKLVPPTMGIVLQ